MKWWKINHWISAYLNSCFLTVLFWPFTLLIRKYHIWPFSYRSIFSTRVLWLYFLFSCHLNQSNQPFTNLPKLACFFCITGFFRKLVLKRGWILVPTPINSRLCKIWITHNLNEQDNILLSWLHNLTQIYNLWLVIVVLFISKDSLFLAEVKEERTHCVPIVL